MTLVEHLSNDFSRLLLCRKAESDALGSDLSVYMSEYGLQGLGKWQVDVQEFQTGGLKSPCNENQAAKGRKL